MAVATWLGFIVGITLLMLLARKGIWLGLLVAAVLVAACLVAIVAVTRMDVAGDGGSGLASSFDYSSLAKTELSLTRV